MTSLDIITEVTGTVWKIAADIGASLKEDDTVIIVESMKMEVPVVAPKDGTLSEILVSEGDSVAENQVVAKMTV